MEGIRKKFVLSELREVYSDPKKRVFVFTKDNSWDINVEFLIEHLFEILDSLNIDREELLTHSSEEIRELGKIENEKQLRKYIKRLIAQHENESSKDPF